MHSAFVKDIIRTVAKEKKRLIALAVIAALGVTMMTGLKAACDDLRLSSDRFFDAYSLHDIEIQSTLGLTEEDVSAVTALSDVSSAQGVYSETVHIKENEFNCSVTMKTFTEGGIDQPYLKDGRLPETAGEIAVPSDFLSDNDLQIGDEVSVILDDDSNLVTEDYTITGTVIDVTDVNNPDGSVSFRSSSVTDYTFLMTPDCEDADYYTSVVLTVEGASDLNCFEDDYSKLIEDVKTEIEDKIKSDREKARTESVKAAAEDEIADAEDEMNEKLADAQAELDDGRAELDDGWQQLEDGKTELAVNEQDAKQQIADARAQIEEAKEEWQAGKEELEDAQAQLDAGREKLVSSQAQVTSGLAQIEDAQAQIDDGKAQIEEAEQQLTEGQAQLDAGRIQLEAGKVQLEAGRVQLEAGKEELQSQQDSAYEQIDEAYQMLEAMRAIAFTDDMIAYIDEQEAELDAQKAEADAQFEAAWEEISENEAALEASEKELAENEAALEESQAQIDAGRQEIDTKKAELESGQAELLSRKAQLEDAQAQIDAGMKELEESQALITSGQAELSSGWQEIIDGENTLDEQEALALSEIEEGRQKLEDSEKELQDAEQEYADGLKEFEDQKAEALQKIADAREELDEIDTAAWYIKDRTASAGYANIGSDADCIEDIGTIFPLMFLIVAVLISLTTMSRMVEENRSLIGTYKALGFSDGQIMAKYVIYAVIASTAGGIIGNICGFIVLPEIIISIFKTMYLVQDYGLYYNALMGFGGILLFMAGITASTVITGRSTLVSTPAILMRPKPPKSGSRIFLERWHFIWHRMSFLNKVTARNLFRYRKRFLMTIFGIAGCMGLLICGFCINDTVDDLMPRQYDQVNHYDLLGVSSDSDNDALLELMDDKEEIASFVNIRVDSVTIRNSEGESIAVTMYVIPDGESLDGYININDPDKQPLDVKDDGFYLTVNACNVLGFEEGDEITVQNLQLDEAKGPVVSEVENYLGNSLFITGSCYESVFGEFKPNAVLINLTDDADPYEMKEWLENQSVLQSVSCTQEMKDSFSFAFTLINLVVYVIIVLAAALAFVVLFTLSTTNISEREREMATIKVLGFYDPEVHRYANKETLILTGFGILAGIPLGIIFSRLMMAVLVLPSIYFAITIHPVSYIYCAVLTFVFALMVSFLTNPVLDRIDPIEALKSVE